MRQYFQVNNQRRKTSGNTAAMCCFLIFDRSFANKIKEDHQQAITDREN